MEQLESLGQLGSSKFSRFKSISFTFCPFMLLPLEILQRARQGGTGDPFYCFAIIPGELCECVCVSIFMTPTERAQLLIRFLCSPALIRLCF